MAGGFRLAEWAVEPQLNTLERNGHTVRLEPKVMQVLVTLSDQPGEVVSKEQIFKRVWPDTFVSDEVLTRSISELRKAFEDNPQEPKYIQTIPKGGYRLVATVVREPANRKDWYSEHWRMLTAATAVLLLAGIASFYTLKARKLGASKAVITSLAVLPLANLSGDAGQDYFADGMTDELTTRLSNIGALRVISRTSVMHYKGTQKTIPEIARELNVDAVLEGSVLRSGEKVRISSQLIQARTDKHLWAESYERDLHDILTLQSDVARAVAQEISIQVTPQENTKLTEAKPVNPEAHDSYLKGLYHWNKFTEEGMRKAVDYFEDAIQKQPNYAAAYAGLAHAYHILAFYVSPNEVMPKGKAAALRALELDPTDAEAHAALGWIKWHYDWDWPGAEQEYITAVHLNPSSSLAHSQYGLYLDEVGRFNESIRECKLAEELDPLSLVVKNALGDSYSFAGSYNEAIEKYQEVLGLDANFANAHASLGMAYVQQGRFEEGVSHLQKATQLDTDTGFKAALGYAYAASGNRSAARKILAELVDSSQKRYISSIDVALVYWKMRNTDQACEWLERAYQERDSNLTDIILDVDLADFRSIPCVQNVLRRIGFAH
jgi:TolB-like protein/DNA-binding winged helix-turn-helix (wHTH) protein/Flp pilus assembly protein TadD